MLPYSTNIVHEARECLIVVSIYFEMTRISGKIRQQDLMHAKLFIILCFSLLGVAMYSDSTEYDPYITLTYLQAYESYTVAISTHSQFQFQSFRSTRFEIFIYHVSQASDLRSEKER